MPGRPPAGAPAFSPDHIQLQFIANNLFTRLASEVVIIPNSAVLVLTPTTKIELDHGCWVLARFDLHPNLLASEAELAAVLSMKIETVHNHLRVLAARQLITRTAHFKGWVLTGARSQMILPMPAGAENTRANAENPAVERDCGLANSKTDNLSG